MNVLFGKTRILTASFALIFLLLPSFAQTAPSKIEIKHADTAEYVGEKHRITLTGAVHVVRGTMSIRADKIVIQLTDDEKEVLNAQANGRVEVVDGTRKGRAAQAVFAKKDSQIILTGDPILFDGPNQVQADRIIYSLEDRTMRASGGVRGFLLPSGS